MKILFISLGCDKNLVDSEQMIALLGERGYEFTDNDDDADIVVINSCAFIKDAKEESIQTIIDAGELKRTGNAKCIVVAGCLAERYSESIKEELPEVDAIVGTTAFDKIVDVVEQVLEKKGVVEAKESIDKLTYVAGKRTITTAGNYEYLKIAEGCNKRCTYCAIPYIRGHYRSVPMEQLVSDARQLAERGVKELILVAQETTVYGIDLYGKKSLPELLRKLCEIDGLEWIRILYCYPEEIDDELIAVMKEQPKICNYLDLPIQHASDRILKAMGRRTSKSELVDIVSTLRREIPDITLRTTLISGFPGETDEEHEELVQFVKDMRFDRLGCFTYSPEEDTPAAEFDGQVEEDVKEERRDEIMTIQQEIAFEKSEEMVGKVLDVMIEGRIPEDHVYVGRTYRDAPGVDGMIFLDETGMGELMTGDYVRALVTESSEYDLIGVKEGSK
ncbi:MAG: 30S ribosomal protein S12 methylthiotransferase RimO [Lachnospiraceae bacterium]|nr:30S ribosomal protein S12 methylthiotransferase RimO [Lachnospiraceae bacterium]